MRSRLMHRIACVTIIALVAGCRSVAEPHGTPAMTGPIVARDVSISIGGPPTVHVKTTPSEECGVIFLVTSSTEIFRRSGSGDLVSVKASELTVGRRVSVWAELVLESCPGQSEAKAIEVLD